VSGSAQRLYQMSADEAARARHHDGHLLPLILKTHSKKEASGEPEA
jgi:hypothetical protein